MYRLVRKSGAAIGHPELTPHDLGRTCAKLRREAGGDLEQIQLLLGHACIQTTEGYLGTKQELVQAANDRVKDSRRVNVQSGTCRTLLGPESFALRTGKEQG